MSVQHIKSDIERRKETRLAVNLNFAKLEDATLAKRNWKTTFQKLDQREKEKMPKKKMHIYFFQRTWKTLELPTREREPQKDESTRLSTRERKGERVENNLRI